MATDIMLSYHPFSQSVSTYVITCPMIIKFHRHFTHQKSLGLILTVKPVSRVVSHGKATHSSLSLYTLTTDLLASGPS